MTLSATRLNHDGPDSLSEEDFDIDPKNETQDQVDIRDYGSEVPSSRSDRHQTHAQNEYDADLQPQRQQRFTGRGRQQEKKRSLKWVIPTAMVVLLGAGTYGAFNYLGISINVHVPDNSLSTLAALANRGSAEIGQPYNSKVQPINDLGSEQGNGLSEPEMTALEAIPVPQQPAQPKVDSISVPAAVAGQGGNDQSPISPELSKQAEALLANDMVPDPVVTETQNVNPQAVSLPVSNNSVLVLEEPLSQKPATVPDTASFEAVMLDISLMKEQMGENSQLITEMSHQLQASEKAFSAMNDHLVKTEKHITTLREDQRNLSQSLESSKSVMDAELAKLKKENQEFRNSLGGIWRRIYNKPFLPDWHVGAVSQAQDGSSSNKAVLVGPNKEMVIVVVGETFKGAKIREINLKEKTVKTSKGTIK